MGRIREGEVISMVTLHSENLDLRALIFIELFKFYFF